MPLRMGADEHSIHMQSYMIFLVVPALSSLLSSNPMPVDTIARDANVRCRQCIERSGSGANAASRSREGVEQAASEPRVSIPHSIPAVC